MRRVSIAALLLCSSAASAAPAPKVLAVFDIEDGRDAKERLPAKRLANLSDYLATLLAKGDAYRLVPSAEIRKALVAEKKESYQACFDEACQIEIGKAVAAEKSVRTSILEVGDQCVLQASIYDLAREVTDKVAHFKGDCDESSIVAAIELVVAELRGEKRELVRDSSGKAIHFDTSKVGRMGELRPPSAPAAVTGLDFGDVDLAELEVFDRAVKSESDDSIPSSEKLALWKRVKKTKRFRTIAVERIEAWKIYIEEEKAAKAAEKRLAAQRTRDWKKMEKLIGMTVIKEEDKVAWVDAFIRAYGSDPAKNPTLEEPALVAFLAERDWKKALEESKAPGEIVAKMNPIHRFQAKYSSHAPSRSRAQARLQDLQVIHRSALDAYSGCRSQCREDQKECQRVARDSCHGASGYGGCLKAQRRASQSCKETGRYCQSSCPSIESGLYGK